MKHDVRLKDLARELASALWGSLGVVFVTACLGIGFFVLVLALPHLNDLPRWKAWVVFGVPVAMGLFRALMLWVKAFRTVGRHG